MADVQPAPGTTGPVGKPTSLEQAWARLIYVMGYTVAGLAANNNKAVGKLRHYRATR